MKDCKVAARAAAQASKTAVRFAPFVIAVAAHKRDFTPPVCGHRAACYPFPMQAGD